MGTQGLIVALLAIAMVSVSMVYRVPSARVRQMPCRGHGNASARLRRIGCSPPPPAPVPNAPYQYEPLERFGEGLTTRRPWNTSALAAVERLNGRVAMLGFLAAVLGEWITGYGPAGQLLALLRWYLR